MKNVVNYMSKGFKKGEILLDWNEIAEMYGNALFFKFFNESQE